jgi:hypothetical protein
MLLAGSLADACVVVGSGWDNRFRPYWNRRAQKQETQAAGGNLPILVGVGGIRKQASRKLLLIPGGFPALERAINECNFILCRALLSEAMLTETEHLKKQKGSRLTPARGIHPANSLYPP